MLSSLMMMMYGMLASILPPTLNLFARAQEQWKMAKSQVATRAARAAWSRHPNNFGEITQTTTRVTRIRTQQQQLQSG